MPRSASPALARLLSWFASLVLLLSGCWAAAAIWYQFPGPPVASTVAALSWLVLTTGALVWHWRTRRWTAPLIYGLAFAGLLIWWASILPSNHRQWADEVAQMTTGQIDGDIATLRQVRNFDWRSETDYTPRWETRTYDLDKLVSADMVLSYWGISAIAHTLVSFGFEDGKRVVFSVEIRKERHESFSAFGGFFKKFDMSVIAADENDIIRVRSNVRGEDVYLFPVKVSRDTMRSLFMAYVGEANALAAEPRFYNTLTANCTTIVYHMMTRIVDGLTLDYRLLASGYLDSYVYDVGGLEPGYALQTLRERGRITDRARSIARGQDFSTLIRQGIPGAMPTAAAQPVESAQDQARRH